MTSRFAQGRDGVIERHIAGRMPLTRDNVIGELGHRARRWRAELENRGQHVGVALERIVQPEPVLARIERHFAEHEHQSMVILGPVGCGKTALAMAMHRERVFRGDHTSIVSSRALPESSRGGYLFIDDLGAENPTPANLARLFGLLDDRWEHDGATIITSNLDLDAFREYVGGRGYDRLDGPTIELTSASRRRNPIADADPTIDGRGLAYLAIENIRTRLGDDNDLWSRWIWAVVAEGLYEVLDPDSGWVEDWQVSPLVAIVRDLFGNEADTLLFDVAEAQR